MKFNSSRNSVAIMRLSRKAGDVAAHTQNHQHGPFLDGTDCFIGFQKSHHHHFFTTHIDLFLSHGKGNIHHF